MRTPIYVAAVAAVIFCAALWVRQERVAAGGLACVSQGKSCSSKCANSSACVSRCKQYAACSLNQDLSGATGVVLDMYVREKAKDGHTYENASLPKFEATRLSGEEIHSTDLVGKPTVLVFLASHCSHSYQTLPILQCSP